MSSDGSIHLGMLRMLSIKLRRSLVGLEVSAAVNARFVELVFDSVDFSERSGGQRWRARVEYLNRDVPPRF